MFGSSLLKLMYDMDHEGDIRNMYICSVRNLYSYALLYSLNVLTNQY